MRKVLKIFTILLMLVGICVVVVFLMLRYNNMHDKVHVVESVKNTRVVLFHFHVILHSHLLISSTVRLNASDNLNQLV
jgi:hypothetical protein